MIIWYYDRMNTNKALRPLRGAMCETDVRNRCAKSMCETDVRVCAKSMCKNYCGGNEPEPAPPGPCANSTLCGLQEARRLQQRSCCVGRDWGASLTAVLCWAELVCCCDWWG